MTDTRKLLSDPNVFHAVLREAFEQAYRKRANDLAVVTVEILDHNRYLEIGAVLTDGAQHITGRAMHTSSGLREDEWMLGASLLGHALACGVKHERSTIR